MTGAEAGHCLQSWTWERKERKLVKRLVKIAKEITCFGIDGMREDLSDSGVAVLQDSQGTMALIRASSVITRGEMHAIDDQPFVEGGFAG